MDRREILGTVASAAPIGNYRFRYSSKRRVSNIGVHVYTVRGAIKRDFEGYQVKKYTFATDF